MSLYVQEGLQRVHFKQFCLLVLEIVLVQLCDGSTGFGSLLRNFTLKRNLSSRISRNIWKIRVFQLLFIAISCMRRFVPRKNKNIFGSRLCRFDQSRRKGCNISSTRIIKPFFLNDQNTSTKKLTLSLDVWPGFFLFCILNVLIYLIILWKCINKPKPMFWDCSLSLHFLVVHNNCFCRTKRVLH